MITVRPFDRDKDYETAFAWWEKHGWTPPPLVFLPALGIVAEDEGKMVAAGWLYLDNSAPVAKMEWLVADPGAKPARVIRALNSVIGFLCTRAREPDLGYAVVLINCRQEGLIKMLERFEFVKMDTDLTQMLLILDDVGRQSYRQKMAGVEAIPQTVLASYLSETPA